MMSMQFIWDVLNTIAVHHAHRDLWWRTDGEYSPLKFFIHCNDVFVWGSSDCEDVSPENVGVLKQSYADSKDNNGNVLFCARVRKMRPQGAYYSFIERGQWPLFDACGPEREIDFGNPHKPGEYENGPYSDRALARKESS